MPAFSSPSIPKCHARATRDLITGHRPKNTPARTHNPSPGGNLHTKPIPLSGKGSCCCLMSGLWGGLGGTWDKRMMRFGESRGRGEGLRGPSVLS